MPFKIIRNDIVNTKADAIVNTANPNPLVGGGTDSAIYKAAGRRELLHERKKIGVIERGQAAVTPAFRLHAKYIIHTVGPIWQGGDKGERETLRACYDNSLKLAAELHCESIAFPMISTGVYGFPRDLALQIILASVTEFLTDHEMMIWLVVFEKKAVRLSEKLFENIETYIDDQYVEKKMQEEFEEDFSAFTYLQEQREEIDHPSAFEISPRSAGKRSISITEGKQHRGGVRRGSSLSQAPRSLDDLMKQSEETFSQMLLRMIREKGLTNAQAYKKANQDKKLFSKIKNNVDYQPNKKTAMAFALALELSLDEAKDLLARAGYAFSPSSNFDKAIQFFIETKEYNIYEIEIVLYDLGLGTLCNY